MSPDQPEIRPIASRQSFLRRLFGLRRRLSWKQAFTALKYPNYRLWFWSQMFSLFGTWMESTALMFLVYKLTGSAAYLGLVGFASGAPSWFFMLYAGVIADRVSRRTLIIITQTAMMLLAFVIAALAFLNIVQPWHILVIAVLLGVANAFEAPARQAFVLEMVDLPDLTNAIALNGAMFNTATAVGPAAAGVVYALFGPAWCFTINGVSFIAVIVALAFMKLKPFVPKAEKTSAIADLKEGIKYVWRHPMIRTITGLIAIVSFFGIPYAILFPAWAVKMLGGGATTNGFLQASRGLGAMAGALLIASLGRFHFRGKLLTLGTLAMPVLIIIFAFVRWTPLSLLLLFGAGVAQIFIFNLCNALVQSFSPHALRGRIMGVYVFVFFGAMPIAALGIGATAQRLGETAAILIGASIMLLAAVLLWIFAPFLREQA
jgi:MFS family permease